MRKVLLLAIIALVSIGANAQSTGNYTFSTAVNGSLALDMNGNTVDMTSGTTQFHAANVDDASGTLTNFNLGAGSTFEFWLMGVRYTQFSAGSNGALQLGTAISGTFYNLPSTTLPLIAPFSTDLKTGSDGEVRAKIVGAAPNRCLVVEYFNMMLHFGSTSEAGTGTYQARLYESTGVIEYVYGAMTRNANTPTTNAVTIGFSVNTTINNIVTVNTSTHTASTSATVTTNTYTASQAITDLNSAADGSRRLYRFTPPTVNAPTGINFTGVTGVATTVNWTDASNELKYALYRSDDGGTTYSYVNTFAINIVTSGSQTGLTPGTTYFWRVYSISEGALSTALQGSQATSASADISSTGAGGNWSSTGTWVGGVVPTASDNATIVDGATVTIDAAASAYSLTVGGGTSGILQFEQITARTLTVGTNVTVAAGGTFRSNTAGTQTVHILSLAGNLTNNGTIDFSTNTNTAGAGITFTGSNNATFSGIGATTDLFNLVMSKSAQSVVVEINLSNFSVRGLSTTATAALLASGSGTGTLKFSGTNTFSGTLWTTTGYSIPATLGIWLNNSNFTINGLNGSPTMSGLLRMTAGTWNVGTATGNAMAGATTSNFIIEGGTMNFTGRLNVTSASAIFNMSAGTINICTIGNASSATASFGFTSTTSVFTMSGGTINLIQRSTGATILDYNVATTTPTITGGTLNVGTAATATNFDFRLQGSTTNLVINNTTNNKSVLASAALNIRGTVTINTGTTINSQTFALAFYNTVTNNGTLTANGAGTSISFLGSSAQTLGGTVTSNQISNLIVNNTAGVTIPTGLQLNTGLTLTNGVLGTASGTLTLGSAGTNAFTYVEADGDLEGTTVVTYNYGTGTNSFTYSGTLAPQNTGTELPAAPSTVIINNTNGVTLNSAINITSGLTLTNGVFTTGGNLTLGNGGSTTITTTRSGGSLSQAPSYNLGTGLYNVSYTTPSPAASITTGVELPASVNAVTINNTSNVVLNSSLGITASGTGLTLTNGILRLGSNDLTLGVASTISGTPTAAKMIAINGAGQLMKTFASGASAAFTFPIGDVTGTAEYSPASLTFSANSTQRIVGIKVTNSSHPSVGAVSDYLNRYWEFTENGAGGTYAYTGSFTYVAADVVGTAGNIRVWKWDGATWVQPSGTNSSNVLAFTTSYSETTGEFNVSEFTGKTLSASTYTWVGGASSSFATAGNWSPARSVLDPTDVLIFDGSSIDGLGGLGSVTATTVTTQTIGRLGLQNNANVTLQSASLQTLTVAGGIGTDIDIPSGSTLTLSTTSMGLTLSASQTSSIAGTLNINSAATYTSTGASTISGTVNVSGTYVFTSGTTTLTGIATLVNSGALTGATATTFILQSGTTYQHNINGGTIPTANYNANSTVLVTAITSTSPTPPASVGNFTWNCPSQGTLAGNLLSTLTTVNGTFNLVSTGASTGSFRWGAGPTTIVTGAATVSGGNYNVAGGTVTYNGGLSVTGGTITVVAASTLAATDFTIGASGSITGGTTALTMNITSGNVSNSGTISGSTGGVTFNFNGTGAQSLTNTGTTSGRVNLTVNKASGTLSLGSNFDISSASILTLTSGPLAINGNILTLLGTVTTTGGTISGSGTSNMSVGASATLSFTSGARLLNNFTMTAGTATLATDLNINGTLTLTSGALAINGNTLTLNAASSTSGTLSGSATSNLVINGAAGTLSFTSGARTLRNLTLGAGATTTLGSALDITAGASFGTVTVGSAAALTSGGNLTLKSDANGTARVAQSSGDGITTGILGNVIVERFIPSGRKWRLLTAPVTGPTLRASWMEGTNNTLTGYGNNQNPNPGFGTHITGTGGTTNGFDEHPTNASSAKIYSGGFSNLVNTTTAIESQSGYMLFVRGNRATDINVSAAGASLSSTVLRATGTLKQGAQGTINLADGVWQMVGNPYPSNIDFEQFAGTANLGQSYYVWDANQAGTFMEWELLYLLQEMESII
jgi:hypothetical protein